MHVIYIDVLFAINWYMDVLIFYCVSLILNQRIKLRRLALAGILASLVYCMLIILPILQSIPYSFYTLFIPTIAILYLYKPQNLKTFIKLYGLCMIVSAIFGGMLFNIWYMFNHSSEKISSIGVVTLILVGLLITIIFYNSFYFIRRRFIFPSFEYEIKISNKEGCVEVKALLDTGNLLYTPITHEPVVVVEYESVKALLSEAQQIEYETYRRCKENEMEEALISERCRPEILIPFKSVGCTAGYLWGIRVDEMDIRKVMAETKVPDCIIGISSESLFSDKQYSALLHPEFILEEARIS